MWMIEYILYLINKVYYNMDAVYFLKYIFKKSTWAIRVNHNQFCTTAQKTCLFIKCETQNIVRNCTTFQLVTKRCVEKNKRKNKEKNVYFSANLISSRIAQTKKPDT